MAYGFYALNFFSPAFADQLRRGRKTATIRLGDKSRKYQRGQLLWVTIGHQHSPREKLFTAVIDDVEVKKASRPLAARHRARQPGVSPRRGDAQLHAPDLRPRDRPRGDGDRRPLLAGPRAAAGLRRVFAQLARAAGLAEYRFLTTWLLDCERERVWEAIYDQRAWPSWWRGVESVVELEPGDENGVGAHSRLTWRSKLPYDLVFEAPTRTVERPRLIEADVIRRARGHRPLAVVRAGRASPPRSTSGTCGRPSAG